jgi:hypothetical protein
MLNETVPTSYFLKDQRSGKRFVRLLCICMPRSHGMTHPSSSRPYSLAGRSVSRVRGVRIYPAGKTSCAALLRPLQM